MLIFIDATINVPPAVNTHEAQQIYLQKWRIMDVAMMHYFAYIYKTCFMGLFQMLWMRRQKRKVERKKRNEEKRFQGKEGWREQTSPPQPSAPTPAEREKTGRVLTEKKCQICWFVVFFLLLISEICLYNANKMSNYRFLAKTTLLISNIGPNFTSVHLLKFFFFINLCQWWK